MSDFHSAYLAHELSRRYPADSQDRLTGVLVDAQVDLNPHQVEAALFAFRSPFSQGVLLADEVGLGKTIEAGLILSQKWAERKRRLLVVAPANLRKQWYLELSEKFFLPCRIWDSKSDKLIDHGDQSTRRAKTSRGANDSPPRPLPPAEILIASYQFARAKSDRLAKTPWDMIVFDEAHRLRNVYKSSSRIANDLHRATADRFKVLLTATPLQNSLDELYGLVSFIDKHTFGDLKTFRERYGRTVRERKGPDTPAADDQALADLRTRLEKLCRRTLRRQVIEYVPFTRRHAMVEDFTPTAQEQDLYDRLSEFLQRDDLKALPSNQRHLITLVLRKFLASSTFAIAGVLDTIIKRLDGRGRGSPTPQAAVSLEDELQEQFEGLPDTLDELSQPPDDDTLADDEPLAGDDTSAEDAADLTAEIAELRGFRDVAHRITDNAKGQALLRGLDRAFAEMARLGAAPKAIVFTESRRTQNYLVQLLERTAHGSGLVLFNGTNNDARSQAIYNAWMAAHAGTDRVTGSPPVDMRSALVDEFRDRGTIMVATEAAAEGINLQFCSLVVNYDLPWNPQRIEQRIGRCHRYGQKHDVVVLNFLNRANQADVRVYELLDQKFQLFSGVFGSSDEVLGAIESGVDFEKRIAEIYQTCRTSQEIADSFAKLQSEFCSQISDRIKTTRQQLLENFDEEVHAKLRVTKDSSQRSLDRYEDALMRLTAYELGPHAVFSEQQRHAFELVTNPFAGADDIPTGHYELPRHSAEAHIYRRQHPLAERLIAQALARNLPPARLVLDWQATRPRVAALEAYRGQSGALLVAKLAVESAHQAEDVLLVSALTDTGELLDPEVAAKLFSLVASAVEPLAPFDIDPRLTVDIHAQRRKYLDGIDDRNGQLFDEQTAKLERWADDRKAALDYEVKELEEQIRAAKRDQRDHKASRTLAEKLLAQRQIQDLDGRLNKARRLTYERQDEIHRERDKRLAEFEAQLSTTDHLVLVMSPRWRVV